MNKCGIRTVACALAGTMALSGYHITLEAKINNLSGVPAAGVAVVLDEGSTIQELQVEVSENIAYLESVSGVQPNIMIATEDVALAEAPVENNIEETIDTDMLYSIETESAVESIVQADEQKKETDISENITKSANEEYVEESVEEQIEINESETVQISSTEPNTQDVQLEEITEVAEEETEEKNDDNKDNVIEQLKMSVGFSAVGIYDIVETKTEEIVEKTVEAEESEEKSENEQDFSGLVIAQVSNYVNVRSLPSEDGEIVGKLYDKSVGEFIEEKDGWYKIKSGNCTGYVKGEYCVTGKEAEKLAKEVGTTYAIVNTTTLKVRQEASTESTVLGLVPFEEELVVVEELEGWVKIAIEEGDGYVSREFVNLRTDFVHAESKEEEEARLAKEAQAREEARAAAEAAEAARAETANTEEKAQDVQNVQNEEKKQEAIEAAQNTVANSQGSEMGKAVIDYAVQFIGNPYVYGGSSLTNGTDCSGFVMSVYSNFGVSLPHSSSALRSKGYDVGGIQNAQPGDIVCYSGHVGLYMGNGQIVHASTKKTGIKVSDASYRTILSVRRIF